MNPLYNTGIALYSAGVTVASMRNAKARAMLAGQKETFGRLRRWLDEHPGRSFDWWFHAASLGEFEQARPLIERIRRENPKATILLTFFSPSGYTVRKDYPQADLVLYLPFDTPKAARRFVREAKPGRAVFAKYEFWGNYLEALHRASIPTYLISAIFRPGQIFFKPWGGMFRRMLGCYDRLFVQDERSRELLKNIGVDNVEITGDTRFDRVEQVRLASKELPKIEKFSELSHAKGRKILVVGSSWGADEDVYADWLLKRKDFAAIIAPHEFDTERLKLIIDRFGSDTRLLSQYDPERDGDVRFLIVDSFGLLSSIYRYADIAYVGGGFGQGIHNIVEAAVYGIPVMFGPRHGKFREARAMIECDGGFAIDRESFTATATKLADDPEAIADAGRKARAYIESQLGATELIYKTIIQQNKADRPNDQL